MASSLKPLVISQANYQRGGLDTADPRVVTKSSLIRPSPNAKSADHLTPAATLKGHHPQVHDSRSSSSSNDSSKLEMEVITYRNSMIDVYLKDAEPHEQTALGISGEAARSRVLDSVLVQARILEWT